MIHYTPETGSIRVYAEGDSYENRDPYKCSMLIHHLEGAAVITMATTASGKLTIRDVKDVFLYLRSIGHPIVYLSRAAGKGMPYAVPIVDGPMAGYYMIDTAQFENRSR